MKRFHNIKVSVFCKEEDNKEEIKKALLSLFPFDLNREKVALKEDNATGFNEKNIKTFKEREEM